MPVIPAPELRLKEIFSSVQGEGVLIGRRQLFVRLAGCNLSCSYCDTEFADSGTWTCESEPGSVERQQQVNPAHPQLLTRLVDEWQKLHPVHHSLALTGGEPLVQAEALAGWLPTVCKLLPVYLETNGTLPQALAGLLPYLSWISMDIKLAATSGAPTPWPAHADFLRLAGEKTCQVKIVVDELTAVSEVTVVAAFVQRLAPRTPLILQPKTVADRPSLVGRQLLRLQEAAAREHGETLVIPQVHPFLAVR